MSHNDLLRGWGEDGDRRRAEIERAQDRSSGLHKTYFEAASKSAETAVKTSVIVNGGAAVAVLGFLGALLQRQVIAVTQIANVSESLIWFAAGVGAGTIALAFIYLMNYASALRVQWEIPLHDSNISPEHVTCH